MTDQPTVALLGTGLMGLPMARNIARARFPLAVWNRTRAKADPLAADGARVTDSPEEAIRGAQIVISMLSDGFATAEMLGRDAVQSALAPGTIWIDMSSARPDQARNQTNLLQSIDCHHLDAPVSGGTRGAEAGTLAIMVGGDAATLDIARPVLAAMGNPVLVGPAGAGQLAKLANQMIVGVTIGAVAEAMLMLRDGGADPAAVRTALKGGFADSTILQQHGARMTNRDFAPGGLSKLQLKDLDNALREAASIGVTLPLAEEVRARFRHLVENMDGANLDHSALFLELEARNARN
jgi:2-hydroxy-3-oxopropionate reductase